MPMGWAGWFSSKPTKIQRSDPNSDTSSELNRKLTRDLHDGESPLEHQDRPRLEGRYRDSHENCMKREAEYYKTRKNLDRALEKLEIGKQKNLHLALETRGLREKCNAASAQTLLEYQDWAKERLDLTNRVSTLEEDNYKLSSQLETSKTHTLVLQGARRASLVSDTVKDVSC